MYLYSCSVNTIEPHTPTQIRTQPFYLVQQMLTPQQNYDPSSNYFANINWLELRDLFVVCGHQEALYTNLCFVVVTGESLRSRLEQPRLCSAGQAAITELEAVAPGFAQTKYSTKYNSVSPFQVTKKLWNVIINGCIFSPDKISMRILNFTAILEAIWS